MAERSGSPQAMDQERLTGKWDSPRAMNERRLAGRRGACGAVCGQRRGGDAQRRRRAPQGRGERAMNEDWVLSVEQLGEYVRRHLAGDPLLRAVRVREIGRAHV